MYFHPNREFSGKLESLKLKKVDDGTYIDNGYRWVYYYYLKEQIIEIHKYMIVKY